MSYSAGFKNLRQDKDFEKIYQNIQRRKTHPPSMARDLKNNAVREARRSPTVVSSSTATRSRFSAVGGPVRPPPAGCGYASSEAGWSNVTGFRKQLDVAGSPQSDYFKSGASKIDRRAEYIGRPLTESCLGTGNNAMRRAERGPYQYEPNDKAEDSDADDDTVLPSDSASQASGVRSRPKAAGLFGEVKHSRQDRHASRSNPFGFQQSHTYSNTGEAPQGLYGERRFGVEERRPRYS